MEKYFNKLFDKLHYERSLLLVLSLTDPDILRQSKFTDHEIDIIKNLALEKVHRQRILREQVAMSILESQLEKIRKILSKL